MSSLKTITYNSVNDIPNQYWKELNCTNNKYYTPEFLNAFEASNLDIDFKYIIGLENKKAVSFALLQVITISIATITKNIKISTILKRFINSLFCNNELKVMFYGNVFLSGEYGLYLKTGINKEGAFNKMTEAATIEVKKHKRLKAIFVKDFVTESLAITNHLINYDYTPMQVEPNMIIYLNKNWQSFEDYKNDLKSKYRVKANKADKTSAVLTVKNFTEIDLANHKNELQLLYENTIANANFNAQVLNLNTYTNLKAIYKDEFIIKTYFAQDKLVGFLSAMVNGNNLDAHFIGLDYSLNKQYAIYPRILNDYVRLGIKHQSKQINLGRTASEIKSTLGALPETLTCYIKHKKTFSNKLIRPFIKRIKIKSFKQHKPFKNKMKTPNTVSS